MTKTDIDKDLENLKSFLNDEDLNSEISFILTSHLICEKYVNEILETMLPSRKHLTGPESKFYLIDKINILRATGKFPEITYSMIVELNRLRNKYSHTFKYTLTEKDLVKIGHYMGEEPFALIMKRDWNNLEKFKPIVFFIFGNLVKISQFKEKIKLK